MSSLRVCEHQMSARFSARFDVSDCHVQRERLSRAAY